MRIAAAAERNLERIVGSLIVAFSPEIDSAHMMALAAKLARGERSELLALYVIEVPYTLPPDAEMTVEERAALDALGAAETIANKNNVAIRTETIKARSTKQAVLDVAKREKANLIILGSYREGKYSGAPLGRVIEEIAADAKCDVLIGVEGKHGTLLVDESVQSTSQELKVRGGTVNLKRSLSFFAALAGASCFAGKRRQQSARDQRIRQGVRRHQRLYVRLARSRGERHGDARPRLPIRVYETAFRQDADPRRRRQRRRRRLDRRRSGQRPSRRPLLRHTFEDQRSRSTCSLAARCDDSRRPAAKPGAIATGPSRQTHATRRR